MRDENICCVAQEVNLASETLNPKFLADCQHCATKLIISASRKNNILTLRDGRYTVFVAHGSFKISCATKPLVRRAKSNKISETTRWPPSSPVSANPQLRRLSPRRRRCLLPRWNWTAPATKVVPPSSPAVTVEPAAAFSSVLAESPPP